MVDKELQQLIDDYNRRYAPKPAQKPSPGVMTDQDKDWQDWQKRHKKRS